MPPVTGRCQNAAACLSRFVSAAGQHSYRRPDNIGLGDATPLLCRHVKFQKRRRGELSLHTGVIGRLRGIHGGC